MMSSKTDQEQAKMLSGAGQVMQNKCTKTSVQNKNRWQAKTLSGAEQLDTKPER